MNNQNTKSTTTLLATLDTKPTETMKPLPPTTMPAKTTTSIKTETYPISDINMNMPTIDFQKNSTTRSSSTRKDIVEHIYLLLFLIPLTFVISFFNFTLTSKKDDSYSFYPDPQYSSAKLEEKEITVRKKNKHPHTSE